MERRVSLTLCRVIILAAIIGCETKTGPQESEADLIETGFVLPHDSLEGAIKNEAPRLSRPWRVSDAPILEIGGIDGPPPLIFSSSSSAVRLGDGRIALLDTGTNEVRYFTESGEYLLTVAGKGEGPGEFVSPDAFMPLRGDSLLVFDLQLRRVTLFDADGELASTIPIRSPEDPFQPRVFARLDDGTFLVLAAANGRYLADGGDTGRDAGWVWLMDAGGSPLTRISPWIGSIMQLPSGDYIPFAVAESEPVWNGRVVHGDRNAYTLRAYDLNGKLNLTFAKAVARHPVSEDDIADLSSRYAGGRNNEVFDSPDLPANHATFGFLKVDRSGNIWIGEYNPWLNGHVLPRPLPGVPATSWSVFDPDGAWLTDVAVPDGFRVTDIGEDYMLGIATGEFDVPYVRMYSLRK